MRGSEFKLQTRRLLGTSNFYMDKKEREGKARGKRKSIPKRREKEAMEAVGRESDRG